MIMSIQPPIRHPFRSTEQSRSTSKDYCQAGDSCLLDIYIISNPAIVCKFTSPAHKFETADTTRYNIHRRRRQRGTPETPACLGVETPRQAGPPRRYNGAASERVAILAKAKTPKTKKHERRTGGMKNDRRSQRDFF